ncbi:MAG: 4-(cytidine 5'-diphospho)-2-C-methyl-D-erythritol kinase [Chloroflexi bacterium]|nr:4-(cytidine 5'-diphospho)-2-C-methyl-D-erythritol kinase [Chloroflexota bacterium]
MMRTTAPAKVNLGIAVSGVRPDGYHELRSVFLRLALADELAVRPTSGSDHLVIEGAPDCPVDGNLVLRATAAFRAAAGVRGIDVDPVAIRLHKRIPMAAGLAGGSSDAAAMLRLLALASPGALEPLALREVAARIGADVPFFVGAAGAALVAGIGETVESLPPPIEPLGVLLVTPPVEMTTPAVFGAWDRLTATSAASTGSVPPATSATAVIDALAAELRAGATPSTITGLADRLRDANDLWPAAVSVWPMLQGWRDDLERALDRPVLLTGSGSTLVALYEDPLAASDAADVLGRARLADGGARIAATASTSPYPPDIDIIEEGT